MAHTIYTQPQNERGKKFPVPLRMWSNWNCYYHLWECCCCFSRVRLCVTPWTAAYQAAESRPWDSLGKNTGVGCHFLLQWECRLV